MRTRKQVVRLNESQLKRIIKESVRKILREGRTGGFERLKGTATISARDLLEDTLTWLSDNNMFKGKWNSLKASKGAENDTRIIKIKVSGDNFPAEPEVGIFDSDVENVEVENLVEITELIAGNIPEKKMKIFMNAVGDVLDEKIARNELEIEWDYYDPNEYLDEDDDEDEKRYYGYGEEDDEDEEDIF